MTDAYIIDALEHLAALANSAKVPCQNFTPAGYWLSLIHI